jgi:hypothetical protein
MHVCVKAIRGNLSQRPQDETAPSKGLRDETTTYFILFIYRLFEINSS